MFFTITLYIALLIFVIGLVYKLTRWLSYKIGDTARASEAGNRFGNAVKGLLGAVFSARIITLVKSFFVDVIFQWRILKEDPLRWIMHICIFAGFFLLFFIHALDYNNAQASPFFSVYYSTLNPYLFLRNLFGLMVVAGVGIAIYRRVKIRKMRRTTSRMDWYAVVILAVIMVSGFFLEATKIVSYQRFQDMAQEYIDPGVEIANYQDDEDLKALMAYWQQNYNVVFPAHIEATGELLERGREMNEENQCQQCHSRPQWAFLSYGVSDIIHPVAVGLTRAGVATGLWYIHFLACFMGLAYLPFSKFFHIFSTPVSLLTNAVMGKQESTPANIATRRAMELDACMHCSTCSVRCSVSQIFDMLHNSSILPSEKLIALKSLASGEKLSAEELREMAEGAHICTSCRRCTDVCPAGINLQDLWFSIREDLERLGHPQPFILARETITKESAEKAAKSSGPIRPDEDPLRQSLNLSIQASTFSNCFECQTCTNVCPVVANFDNPRRELGLLPHQIMHSLGLGLRNDALSSRMVWDCVTCYQCQEHCPQGVQVADVLYELRNFSYETVHNNSADSDRKKATV